MAETWRSEFDAFDQDQCEETSRRRARPRGLRETYFAAGYQIGVNDTKAQPLLAAAPDLLAAVSALVAAVDGHAGDAGDGVMCNICAAVKFAHTVLAKVSGEASRG